MNYQEEFFKAIDVITSKKISSTPYTYTVLAKIVAKPNYTTVFCYTVLYQGAEILAWPLGKGSYEIDEEVTLLVTNSRFSDKKFILGSSTPDESGGSGGTEIQQHIANSNIHVTKTDKTRWDNKSDFNGDYNYLLNRPTIPTRVGQLQNDLNYATVTQLNTKVNASAFNTHVANTDVHTTITEKTKWNNKSDFSGEFKDLLRKPNTVEGYGIVDALSTEDKGRINGVASLDASGKVPKGQLPTIDWSEILNPPYIPTKDELHTHRGLQTLEKFEEVNGVLYYDGVKVVGTGGNSSLFEYIILVDADNAQRWKVSMKSGRMTFEPTV